MTGRIKGLNNWHTLKAVALTAAAVVVLSCQNEQIQENLDGRITLYPIIESQIETSVMTRAAIDYSKYREYTDGEKESRQVLSVQAISFDANTTDRADKDAGGTFAPLQPTGWRSGVKVEVGYKYDLYAYSRTMPSPTDPTFSYQNGSASLTFNGLYLLTTLDPLVCVAASGATMPENPDPNVYPYPTLMEKVFDIGLIEKTTVNQVEMSTKAFLAMDHLYSKSTLSICIDPTYNELRDIKIKDIEISTHAGTLSGSHRYTFSNNQITLASENSSLTGDSIMLDLFGDDADITTLTLEPGSTEYTLTTEYQEFGYFYFLPRNPLQPIKLTVTYDVYDKSGNKTRADQVAVNDNLFQSIKSSAQKGYDYKLKVTVGPTYLYQLSDDDAKIGLTIQEQQ